MRVQLALFVALTAVVMGACTGQRDDRATSTASAAARDFGDVTMEAFERHPNLRGVPEGPIQDSMFFCALSWRSDHTTPEAERLVNAAKAYDLMAEGNWKAIDPYCRLSALKKHLP